MISDNLSGLVCYIARNVVVQLDDSVGNREVIGTSSNNENATAIHLVQHTTSASNERGLRYEPSVC